MNDFAAGVRLTCIQQHLPQAIGRPLIGWLAVFLAFTSIALAQNEADEAFIERAALRSADAQCNLLDASEKNALALGYWQARGALLRGGYTLSEVDAMQFEAADYAAAKDCDDQAMGAAADRLKNAFLAFSKTPYMELTGLYRQWTATRTLTDVWGVHQIENSTSVRLGLVHLNRALDPLSLADPNLPREIPFFAALLPIPQGSPPPATAIIVMRDPEKEPRPWLGGPFGRGGEGLSTPPRSLTVMIHATERIEVDAPPYDDKGATPGILFLFDLETRRRFEALDPREAVRLQFIPSDRDREGETISVLMEVGDFRAAAAFNAIPRSRPKPEAPETPPEH